MYKLRTLIVFLLIGYFWFITPVPIPAAENPIVIRIGHIQSTDQSQHSGLLKCAEIVSKKTNDRIQVKVFPSSQLGSATAQLGNVKMGTQEMLIEAGPLGSRLEPDFLALLVPFLIRDKEHVQKIFSGAIGLEMVDKLVKKHGIRVLTSNWDRGPRQLLTKIQVSNLADLKGLKIRVPGNPVFLKSWKALGAAPTPMEFSEIYLGLQQGIVDGVELPLDMIYTQKYYEIAKYCALTYHWFEWGSVFANDKFFQSLSPGDQKIVQDALVEGGNYQNKVLADQLTSLSDQMKKGGVIFTNFPETERQKAAAIAQKVGEDEEVAGKWTKGLISKIREVH
ncbi:MAG: TRAP transporter substrate-binding protein [Thermodesulfobacteriota bacterium]